MADEPQRQSEQALREWAAQRRAATPPVELHPATRQMLQAEVARVHGAASPPASSTSTMGAWWLRWVWAGGAVAALVVLLFVLWPEAMPTSRLEMAALPEAEKTGGKLAFKPEPATSGVTVDGIAPVELKLKTDTATPALAKAIPADRASAVAPAAAASPPKEIERKALRQVAPVPAQPLVASDAAVAFAAPRPSSMRTDADKADFLQKNQEPAQTRSLKLESAPVAPAAPVPATSSVMNFAGQAAKQAPETQNAQWFLQSAERSRLRRNFNSPPPAPVLNSFQFTQSGPQVTITDEDGSVYAGQMLGSLVVNGANAAREQQAPVGQAVRNESAGRLAQAAPAQTLLFRVQGTNRTLNQRVEFEGNLLMPSPVQTPAPGQLPSQNLFQGGLIQGRAFIGRESVDVRANAVPESGK